MRSIELLRSRNRSTLSLACAAALVSIACDGSGLGPEEGTTTTTTPEPDEVDHPDQVEPNDDIVPEPEVRVDDTVFQGTDELAGVAPTRRPLPSGITEGATLVVAKRDLKGRFLYGIGADPDGAIGSIGGGAAGLSPIRAVIVLVPDDVAEEASEPADGDVTGGTMEIRVWDTRTHTAVPGDDGLIESYPYSDVDDKTIRVDFSAPDVPLEIALYGSCRYLQTGFELEQPPLYQDALLTWPARETFERSGQCQWVPRTAGGVMVHYLRHDLAGRDFIPRPMSQDAPFGFFLAGEQDAPMLDRMPGIDPAEPPITHTYYLVDFPEQFIPAAEATFDAWNDALEEITGRRPFAVAIAPDDLIPWDPRHHAVVFDTSDSGVGAVAPFTEDPETGEIYQSLVVMWFGNLSDMHETYSDFFGEHADVADLLLPPAPGEGAALPRFEGFDRAAAIARPVRPADVAPRVLTTRPYVVRPLDLGDVPRELMREATAEELDYVITVDFLLHEVGHNLGLRHNFIASADKRRHSAAHSATSTMDYVIGMLDPGSYDRDAMRYAYSATAPKVSDYLFCTDETMDLDPACIPWDWGNPVRYELDLIDAYFAHYTPETSTRELDGALRELETELSRARRFVNTDYEKWDELEIDTFSELLAQVDCQKDCTAHTDLRSALALYLLYTRYMVTAVWEPGYPDVWMEFPQLTLTQAALLMDTYFSIVVGREEPLDLKLTIVNKLPTSAVTGAKELLERLQAHYAGLSAMSGDEPQIKAAVDAALATL